MEQLNLLGEVINSKEKNKSSRSVISASRRTDIPAFFYDWLQDSLERGMIEVPNPMFPNKRYIVDLNPQSVHSIVLWSKNFANVLKNPKNLNNYNIYFQYTINNYSKMLEPNVPSYTDSLSVLEGLLGRYKPEQFNIRFDPVVISTKGEQSPTPNAPEKARLIAFDQLCKDLKILGMENCRVTTSYLAMYGHLKNKIGKSGLDIVHLDQTKQIEFFSQMSELSYKYGISLYSCASPIIEQVSGIKRGHCIDGELLERLFGGKVKKSKDNGQREACGCTYSREIGIYSRNLNGMKCGHGCKYCYVMGTE